MFSYIIASYFIRYLKTGSFKWQDKFTLKRSIGPNTVEVSNARHAIDNIFNSATMAISIILLWGIMDPDVLRLIGDTTPYLAIGAFAGVVYSGKAMFD